MLSINLKLRAFIQIWYLRVFSEGIPHPVFYGDQVYKLRRIKREANFVFSGSKIVKRLRRQKYDPVIIASATVLVLGLSTALYIYFLKHCIRTNKAWELYEGTCPNLLLGDKALILAHLIVCRDSFTCRTWVCFQMGGEAYFGVCLYIYFWYTVFIIGNVCIIIWFEQYLFTGCNIVYIINIHIC